MHFSERLHSWYFALPDFHKAGYAGKAIDKLLGKVLKRVLDVTVPHYYAGTIDRFPLPTSKRSDGGKIICSLTSFPARIHLVWIAIESLFRQTVSPDRIVLWLSEDEFPGGKLPTTFAALQEKGLEVYFRKGNLRAHKKYIFALEQFPDDFVITFDDDLYHDRHSIENLLRLKKEHPDAIVTNRAHKIVLSSDRKRVLPYRKWQHNNSFARPSRSLIATGGCGTLYEKRLLHPDVCNEAKIKALSFYADDIWLKVMAHKQGTLVVTNNCYGKDPIVVGRTQREKLVTTNVLKGGNDQQLEGLMKHYRISPDSFVD